MQRKEVSQTQWKLIVWIPIIIGAIVFSIFSSTFYIPKVYMKSAMYAAIGGVLVGWGFGLAYARAWKIKNIDN